MILGVPVDREALEAVAHLSEAGLFDEGHRRRDYRGRWVKSDFGGGLDWKGSGSFGDGMVRLDSPIFGKNLIGYVHDVTPDGRSAHVRVELDDDHPAMVDTLADNPQLSPDQAEFIDVVPISQIRDLETGEPLPDPRPELERLAYEKRVATALEDNRRRRAAATALPRRPTPELDASRRARQEATTELMRRRYGR